MPRRYQDVGSDNHERWVVSYADFVTLLFAFFVVMYSVSSVNEGKYKVLSESLENVFAESAKTLSVVSVGQKNAKALKSMEQLIVFPVAGEYASDREYEYGIEGLEKGSQGGQSEVIENGVEAGVSRPLLSEAESIEQLYELRSDLQNTFDKLIGDGTLSVSGNDQFIEIEIKNSVLFKSGSANASKDARFVMRKIASMLSKNENSIQVEGFTDNVPIQNEKFPSNWELSAARAATIVRMLTASQINPKRLAAVGYGEYQPVADNSSVEGRKQNRRVALIISRHENIRRQSSNTLSIEEAKSKKGVFDPFEEMGNSIAKAAEGMQGVKAEKEPVVKEPVVKKPVVKPFRLKGGGLLFTADPDGRIDLDDN